MDKKTRGPISSGKTENLASTRIPCRILLAEDDNEMRALLVFALQRAGYEVIECLDGVGLLAHLEPFLNTGKSQDMHFSLIISDIRMPGLTGLEVLEGIKGHNEFPPVILITAFGDQKTHEMAEILGAAAIFDKPFDVDDLLTKVRELLPPP